MKKVITAVLFVIFVAITFILWPLGILWLFDRGWWMILCEIILYAEILAYLIYSICNMEYAANHPDKTNAFISTMAGTLIFPLALYIMLPFWMTDSEFLKHLNFFFGTNFDTIYEFGIIVTWIMSGFCFVLFGFITGYLTNIIRLLKNRTLRAHTVAGIVFSLLLCATTFFFYQWKDKSFDSSIYPMFYRTQMEKEEFEIDQRIESDKQRLIQKAVNDYRHQSE